MKALMAIFLLFAGLPSCVPADPEVIPLSGTYIGYFHRNGTDTARVTLRFEDYRFEGISNKEAYPAIGSGRFKQSGSVLVFIHPLKEMAGPGAYPALAGEYNYLYNDDGTLRIWKEDGQTEDEFILKSYTGETVMSNDAGSHPPIYTTIQ
jgi:hypothetical protein